MAESETVQIKTEEIWAGDRRKAAMAARLMACCLGIQARPGFDLTGEQRGGYQHSKVYAMGECVFKDAWDVSPEEEEFRRLELLLVDEEGNILAKSEQHYTLGHALDLLERLPLRVSPHANNWLKNALGEPGPATARPSSGATRPLVALGNGGPELRKHDEGEQAHGGVHDGLEHGPAGGEEHG